MLIPLFISLFISVTLAQTVDVVSQSWFAGWHAVDVTPTFGVNDLSWEKYNSVVYSFA